MNRTRATLCGVALAVCAAGAAADDDGFEARFERCLGDLVFTFGEMAAEFPDAYCAARAAADDDDFGALFARCLGSLIETYGAMAAEFPDRFGGFQGEAMLLGLRELQEDPEGAFLWEFIRSEGERGKAVIVSDWCALADGMPALLEALRSGNPDRIESVVEALDGRFAAKLKQRWNRGGGGGQ